MVHVPQATQCTLTEGLVLSNFKLLQNDPETGRIFSQPPLISFKRDKNVGNFLVTSTRKGYVYTNVGRVALTIINKIN